MTFFSLKMALRLLVFLCFFGIAFTVLPHERVCDEEERRDTPTLCSNYANIIAVYAKKEELQEMLNLLKTMFMQLNTTTHSNSNLLKELSKNLSHLQTHETKTNKNQQIEINNLKEEVLNLNKHNNETLREDFDRIEQKLEQTQSLLDRKEEKIKKLESQSEADFNQTRKLLNMYKNDLSKLNTTARDLEDKVAERLNVTKSDFEDELKKIQKKNEELSTTVNVHNSEIESLKLHTKKNLESLNQHLTSQNITLNLLKKESGDLSNRLIQLQDTEKVAFSATIIDCPNVFTGPNTGAKSVLVYDKVFTNIGNAYNKNTGTFEAPVKGVYQFTFMTFGYNSHTSGAILVKNGHYQVSTWEFTGSDASDTTSNTVILEMNVGDCVNVILWKGGKIHTSVFSGFLIFPLV